MFFSDPTSVVAPQLDVNEHLDHDDEDQRDQASPQLPNVLPIATSSMRNAPMDMHRIMYHALA